MCNILQKQGVVTESDNKNGTSEIGCTPLLSVHVRKNHIIDLRKKIFVCNIISIDIWSTKRWENSEGTKLQ
jgi:hypothetical protein